MGFAVPLYTGRHDAVLPAPASVPTSRTRTSLHLFANSQHTLCDPCSCSRPTCFGGSDSALAAAGAAVRAATKITDGRASSHPKSPSPVDALGPDASISNINFVRISPFANHCGHWLSPLQTKTQEACQARALDSYPRTSPRTLFCTRHSCHSD